MTNFDIDIEIRSVVLISDDEGLLWRLYSALGRRAETRIVLDSGKGWFWATPNRQAAWSDLWGRTKSAGIASPTFHNDGYSLPEDWEGNVLWWTRTGHSGIQFATRKEPDVVILSAKMSDLDSNEICQQIRMRSRVPIMVVSDFHRADELCRFLMSGADYYVYWPTPLELRARIRSLIRRSRLRLTTLNGPISPSRN